LGLRHPPNGFEFGIGCGQCPPDKKGSPSDANFGEDAEARAEADAKIKAAIRMRRVEVRRWDIADDGIDVEEEEKVEEEKKGDASVGSVLGLRPPTVQKRAVIFTHELRLSGDILDVKEKVEEAPKLVTLRQSSVSISRAPSLSASLSRMPSSSLSLSRSGSSMNRSHLLTRQGSMASIESSKWYHACTKRTISYGSHLFQIKLIEMPEVIPGSTVLSSQTSLANASSAKAALSRTSSLLQHYNSSSAASSSSTASSAASSSSTTSSAASSSSAGSSAASSS